MIRGRTVYHCHGSQAGQPIQTFRTVAEAKRFHWKITHSRAAARMKLKGK